MKHFLRCINVGGHSKSLTLGRVYEYIPSERADERNMYQVLDDTSMAGEAGSEAGYLFPKSWFVVVDELEVSAGELAKEVG